MANDNYVQIIGNVTRDPELRFTNSGVAVCSFGVAWTPRRRNPQTGEWEDGEVSFFNCSAWRDLGENIAASIHKGTRVIVTGQVRARDWEDREGNKRTSIDITVDECAPSLRWAQAQIERTSRSSGGDFGGASAGGNAGGAPQQQPDPVYGDEEPF